MRLHLDSQAELQIADAAMWYDSQQEGLGSRFLDSVDEAVLRIRQSPTRWPQLSVVPETESRYVAVKGFPYIVVYRYVPDEATIVSVSHAARLR
jgi:hypothetical protein